MIGLPISQVVVTFEPCMYVAICSGSVSAAHTRSGVAATSVWAVATYPAMSVSSSDCMTYSYNNQMAASVHPRLENLLASLSLNLAEESQAALERAAGLSGSATAALLALEEFLGDAHVGRLADVLGLTHSGAVRLVTQLETEGLAVRRTGDDRRRVQVRLTARGRRRAAAARAARDAVISETTSGPGRLGGRRSRRPAREAGRGPGGRPDRQAPPGRGGRLVVPHLRLRGLRPTGGPLPGTGHRGSPVV